MVENLTVSQKRTAAWYVPLVADLLGLLFFGLVSRYFVQRFGRNSIDMSALATAMIFALFYIGFLIGVVFLRKQITAFEPHPMLNQRTVVAPLAIIFAVAFVMIVAHLTGYLSLIFDINFGDMGNSYYFLVTPAVYLFIGLLYLFVLTQPVSADKDGSSTSFASLLLVNLFIAVSACYFVAVKSLLFEDWSAIALGVVAYTILLLFFVLPRLIYLDKTRQWFSLLTFDLALVAYAAFIALA